MTDINSNMNNDNESNFRHTCVTCRVMFSTSEGHREHFKSDWHRYNIKRKIVDFPPLSAEAFRWKVQEMAEKQV